MLGPEEADHLLLHRDVLAAASPFFTASMKACWNQNAPPKTVINPATGEGVEVYKYSLVCTEGVACLELTNTRQTPPVGHIREPIYKSKLAAGFASHPAGYEWRPLREVVREHQALFLFFYKIPIEQWVDLSCENIANVIAYAEMYQLLPQVAGAIAKHLLERDGIWSEVRSQPIVFLGIAEKIRSVHIFCDALRHVVGSRESCWSLTYDLGYSEEKASLMILPKREDLQRETDYLIQELQRLGLTLYIAHYNTDKAASPVGSTFLASGFHQKSDVEIANHLARSIWNEWLLQHLAGLPHWSHTTYSQGDDGDFQPASLRELCNAIVRAVRWETELSLFDRDAPFKFVSMFFPRHKNKRELQTQISDALRLLVRTACRYCQPLISTPPTDTIPEKPTKGTPFRDLERPPRRTAQSIRGGRRGGRGGRTGRFARDRSAESDDETENEDQTPAKRFDIGCQSGVTKGGLLGLPLTWSREKQTARDEDRCNYFTCIELSKENLPWKDEESWKEYAIDGLKNLSDEWFDAVLSAYPQGGPEAGEKNA